MRQWSTHLLFHEMTSRFVRSQTFYETSANFCTMDKRWHLKWNTNIFFNPPIRRKAIIWTNAGILLIQSLWTKFSEILIEINIFSSRKWVRKCRPRNVGHFVSASLC